MREQRRGKAAACAYAADPNKKAKISLNKAKIKLMKTSGENLIKYFFLPVPKLE
jgi:hypothetical protein